MLKNPKSNLFNSFNFEINQVIMGKRKNVFVFQSESQSESLSPIKRQNSPEQSKDLLSQLIGDNSYI